MRILLMQRMHAAVLLCISMFALLSGTAVLAQADSMVAGLVASVDGKPINDAIVTLSGNGAERAVRTDSQGRFAISNLPGGTYAIRIVARGYDPLPGHTIDVRTAGTTGVSLELVRSSSSLLTIGRVATRSGEALSTSSAPSQDLSAPAAAARGERSVGDMLAQDAISVTVIHPAGAGPAAPLIVALRGPDPTETLVDVDGHSVNSGGTGSFDLSLLDPADLSSVQLVYGISPSSLVGPNTIDGAINVRTLEPTAKSHGLFRWYAGSFGAFGETVQATGTQKRLGYAFSLHRATTDGEVRNQQILAADGSMPTVGSTIDATTALGKVRYTFGRGDSFVALTVRDQSQFRDLSAALTSISGSPGGATPPPATGDQSLDRRPLDVKRALDATSASAAGTSTAQTYNSFAGSSLRAHNAGYGLDLQLPLGTPASDGFARTTLLLRHLTAASNQSVFGAAAGSSLYLYNDHDLLGDDSLEVNHVMPKATLSLKFTTRSEQLDTQQVIAGTPTVDPAVAALRGLGQTQRSAVMRYAFDPTAQLHYTLATYYSNFTSFGTSLDPRAGFVWTPTARSAMRVSAGSTFQSPQLPELFVPTGLPPPDSSGYVDIGNPNLKADHATEYDLGYEHIFAGAASTRLSVDLYRTNLRTPAQRYYPSVTCSSASGVAAAPTSCESFPINAGGAVYRGIELRLARNVTRSTTVRAAYSINSNYVTSVSPLFQNGTIVVGEQFAGSPLHQATVSFEHRAASGIAYEAGVSYQGGYNGLNRPAFATLHAGLTWHLPTGLDAGLYGTNFTNVYADRFTRAAAGVTYGGLNGPIASDAYALQGRALTFAFTRHY